MDIIDYEIVIRLTSFFGIFLLMACWEMLVPCRRLSVDKLFRWRSNIGIVVINSLMLRLLVPLAATAVAIYAQSRGWGLFNALDAPLWLAAIGSVVALDCVIYGQHRAFHYFSFFWRFHKMHHADLDFDVTTGARFHPLEIFFSQLIKGLSILVLGPPVVAVILFEVILNGTAMFNHSNVSISTKLDRVLRWFVVTPDMHRVHHSVKSDEHNSNFGFNLPWWDRLFGSYRQRARGGNCDMTIGLNDYRDYRQADSLIEMLKIPFISQADPLPAKESDTPWQ